MVKLFQLPDDICEYIHEYVHGIPQINYARVVHQYKTYKLHDEIKQILYVVYANTYVQVNQLLPQFVVSVKSLVKPHDLWFTKVVLSSYRVRAGLLCD